MGYNKVQQLLTYAGIVASGMAAGAIFTGVAVKLPMLLEAQWAREASHIRFDSRQTGNWCEVEKLDPKEAIAQ